MRERLTEKKLPQDEKLLLQEEIFGDEHLRTARSEQFDNRGQDVGENNE